MNIQSQFAKLWEAGCRPAIWKLVTNSGKSLTRRQLHYQLRTAARRPAVSHAIVLTKLLGGQKLGRMTTDILVQRCLRLGWIADALYAVRNGGASHKTRQLLIKALVLDGAASNRTAANKMLSPDY